MGDGSPRYNALFRRIKMVSGVRSAEVADPVPFRRPLRGTGKLPVGG